MRPLEQSNTSAPWEPTEKDRHVLWLWFLGRLGSFLLVVGTTVAITTFVDIRDEDFWEFSPLFFVISTVIGFLGLALCWATQTGFPSLIEKNTGVATTSQDARAPRTFRIPIIRRKQSQDERRNEPRP